MREQRRACAVLGLGPFAHRVLDSLPAPAPAGPRIYLRLRPAPSRAGHDWLPASLRGPGAPSLEDTRAGRRLDVLASGRATLRAHEPALRGFAGRCRELGVPASLLVVTALFDAESAGLLDLAAILGSMEALDGVDVHVLAALAPPSDASEPRSAARAALTLAELDVAGQGSPWELPQPGGVLVSSQAGMPAESALLVWPAGPRWDTDEAVAAVADAVRGVPWLPEIPTGLAALRCTPVLAPAADLRERLADRAAANTVERWLAPGEARASLEDVESRVLAGAPSEGGAWLERVQRRVGDLRARAAEVARDEPDAAADLVRGEVPALTRQVEAELGVGNELRQGADDAARRWVAGARAQALAVGDELCRRGDGGGFALIELLQQAPERLAERAAEAERRVGRANPQGAADALAEATEALKRAVDKPAGLKVRLLGKAAPRLLEPLDRWASAFVAWAEAHHLQAAARVEAGALRSLHGELLRAANQAQQFEILLREAAEGLRRSGRAANEAPRRGIVVLPTGAEGLDDAADSLEQLSGVGGQGWLQATDLAGDPSAGLVTLRDRLRSRLGAAEARLTLGGALASLPAEGPAREELDRKVAAACAPLVGGEGREETVAVLPPDAEPTDLGIEGLVVRDPRREDGLLLRLAGGLSAASLGLRKSALDEGLARLVEREPNDPDVLWRRFEG